MPYASKAQAAYFNMHPDKVGGKKVVDEFNAASKGMKMPQKASKSSKHEARKRHK